MSISIKGSALDRHFPAIWLLICGAVACVVLMVFCGWRILLLEGQARELARERLLLERDRDEFMTYGSDLPQLVEQHKALELQTRQYENRCETLKKTVSELEDKRGSLAHETQDLLGAVTELKAQAAVAGNELSGIKAELEKLRPEGDAARRQVGLLQAQEKALNESLAQKQKREAALGANLEAMERRREHTESMLSRMVEDRDSYASFQKAIDERLARFEGILARAGEMNGLYGQKLEEMDKFKNRMEHGLESLEVDLRAIAATLENVRKDRAAYGVVLAEIGDNAKNLQNQVETITASGKRFGAILDNAENSDRVFQATLLTEAAAINRMASEDAQARSQLSQTAVELERASKDMKEITRQLREDGGQIRMLLASQQGELAGVAEAAGSLANQLEKGRQGLDASLQAGTTLAHSAVALTDQVEEVKSRLKMSDLRTAKVEKFFEEQGERLGNLAALAQALSQEIDENRRLGMRLRDVLAEIREHASALGRPDENARNPEEGNEGENGAGRP